jgi:hypothetical protein
MNLREALADKESTRQENAMQFRKDMTEMSLAFSRTPLLNGIEPPDAATVKAVLEAEQTKQRNYLSMLTNRYSLLQADPPADPPANSPRVASVSRLILFMAGHAAIGIGTSLSSCAIYFFLIDPGNKTEMPSFNSLVGVLLALGIGVVPYAVNRLTADKEADETTKK